MVSKLGYRKDSPYKNRKSLTIDSNHITMKDVEFPLLLVPNNDNPVIAKPGEEYMFNNSRYVKEYRLKNMKYGGQTEELLMAYMAKMKPEEQAEFMARFEELGAQEKKMLLNSLRSQMHEVRNKYEDEDYMEMEDESMEEYMYGGKKMKQGGIYIDPAKRGTFKAQATRMGMGVQQAANQILSNKEDYSPAMVKKANFARNAASWKKEDGGMIEYGMGGKLPEYQPGGMAPREAVTDTNRPLNPIRPVGMNEKTLTPEQSRDVAAFVSRGMSRAEAVDLVLSDKVVLPPPGVRGGPGTLALVGGASAVAARPVATTKVARPAKKAMSSKLPPASGANPMSLRSPGPGTMAAYSTSSLAGATMASTARGRQAREDQVDLARQYLGNLQTGMVDSESVRPEAQVTGWGVAAPPIVPKVTYTAQGPTATVTASRLPARSFSTTSTNTRPATSASQPIAGDTYTIKSGDTLSQIARKAGVSVEELAALNNIKNVNMIRAGSTLRLRPQQEMQTMQAPASERVPVVPLTPLSPRNTFGPDTKVTLQPNSLILKGLEGDLPEAMQNVSRAMAQEPKKRRFSNRRTR